MNTGRLFTLFMFNFILPEIGVENKYYGYNYC